MTFLLQSVWSPCSHSQGLTKACPAWDQKVPDDLWEESEPRWQSQGRLNNTPSVGGSNSKRLERGFGRRRSGEHIISSLPRPGNSSGSSGSGSSTSSLQAPSPTHFDHHSPSSRSFAGNCFPAMVCGGNNSWWLDAQRSTRQDSRELRRRSRAMENPLEVAPHSLAPWDFPSTTSTSASASASASAVNEAPLPLCHSHSQSQSQSHWHSNSQSHSSPASVSASPTFGGGSSSGVSAARSRLPPPPGQGLLPSYEGQLIKSASSGQLQQQQRQQQQQQQQHQQQQEEKQEEKQGSARKSPVLLPSPFKGRPDVILFGATRRKPHRTLYHRGVAMSAEEAPNLGFAFGHGPRWLAIVRTCEGSGLQRLDDIRLSTSLEELQPGCCCLIWSSHVTLDVVRQLQDGQHINHFPGSENLGRKDLLMRHLSRMQERFGSDFLVAPIGFVLPQESRLWRESYQRQPDVLWIWKPSNGRCGKHISVIHPGAHSSDSEEDPMMKVDELSRRRGVVQRYIAEPLLLGGFKFDLRIYVVVTSFDPLKVYLNTEGLVRLATAKYSSDFDTLNNRTMHLTNYSINKHSENFVPNKGQHRRQEEEDDSDGDVPSKWCFGELREYFAKAKMNFDGLFEQIVDLIIKTLISVEPSIRAASNRSDADISGRCFEIYGFDVMVDQSMRPWLLEVNIYPSLRTDSPLDRRIKTELVADTLTLVGIHPSVPPTNATKGPEAQDTQEAQQAQAAAAQAAQARPSSLWAQRPVRPARRTFGQERRSPQSHRSGVQQRAEERQEQQPQQQQHQQQQQQRLKQRQEAARHLASLTPRAAVEAFDEHAWAIALDAHEEGLRGGALKRIFPSVDAGKYLQFFEGEESFANVVLRKWHEAGGGDDILHNCSTNSRMAYHNVKSAASHLLRTSRPHQQVL